MWNSKDSGIHAGTYTLMPTRFSIEKCSNVIMLFWKEVTTSPESVNVVLACKQQNTAATKMRKDVQQGGCEIASAGRRLKGTPLCHPRFCELCRPYEKSKQIVNCCARSGSTMGRAKLHFLRSFEIVLSRSKKKWTFIGVYPP